MIESVNDHRLATAGDDTAGLWESYMAMKAADFRRTFGPYAVPTKDEIKQWAREAQALTQELGQV